MTEQHPGGPGRLYKISRVNALLACEEGEQAFRRGLRPSDCSFLPSDTTQEFLSHFWLAGWWLAARPGVDGARRMHFARTIRGYRIDDLP